MEVILNIIVFKYYYMVLIHMFLFKNIIKFIFKFKDIFHLLIIFIISIVGPNTYDDQIKYIEEKFEALNSNPAKTIYMHETCATDTNQVI
jgi:hypothetical protein